MKNLKFILLLSIASLARTQELNESDGEISINEDKECHSLPFYPCCASCDVVRETDEGEWGIENDEWCGIKESCNTVNVEIESEEDSEYSVDEDVRVVDNGVIYPDDPYIYYVGRWDKENVSQWAGSGFKLDFTGSSFTFVSGERSKSIVPVAYSIDYQTLQYRNITIGENLLVNDLEDIDHNIQFYVTDTDSGFLQMESLHIDNGSKIHKYEPLDKYIQIVGDSLTAGQYLPNEQADSWSFLFGKYMNAETDIIAKPGICLSDIPLYGMDHGMEVSYFLNSNPLARSWGYISDEAHDFSERKAPDLMIIFLGTNDAGNDAKVVAEDYYETLKKFLTRVREIYPETPLAITSLLYDPGNWNEIQSNIVNEFDNIYYIYINDPVINSSPNIYLTNYHLTQKGSCALMKTMVEKVSQQIGFEKQEKPTNKWGMHGNLATGYEICDNPIGEELVYHYAWENAGGIGAW